MLFLFIALGKILQSCTSHQAAQGRRLFVLLPGINDSCCVTLGGESKFCFSGGLVWNPLVPELLTVCHCITFLGLILIGVGLRNTAKFGQLHSAQQVPECHSDNNEQEKKFYCFSFISQTIPQYCCWSFEQLWSYLFICLEALHGHKQWQRAHAVFFVHLYHLLSRQSLHTIPSPVKWCLL